MIGMQDTQTTTKPEIIIDDPLAPHRDNRMRELGVGPVSEIRKNTPERKCLHQKVVTEGGVEYVTYLHVTKGWRRRRVTGYATYAGHKDWSGFNNLIAKAQKAKLEADKAIL